MKDDHMRRGVAAGMMISLGGYAQLKVGGGLPGALLFSIGLLAILAQQYKLFTGMVCVRPQSKSAWIVNLASALINNLIGVCLVVLCVAMFDDTIHISAQSVMAAKIAKTPRQLFTAGILCEWFIATAITCRRPLVTVLAVAGFIMSGGEHCIADAFYALVAMVPGMAFNIQDILTVFGYAVLGNIVGGIFWAFCIGGMDGG